MRDKKDLKSLLNLNFLNETNLTFKLGDLDMPYITCKDIGKIDYLATYSQPATYFKTPNTCVSFFEYDKHFDGIHGLWNGIYYDNKEILEQFEERFKNVKCFIAPDYSKCGDIPEIENMYRQFKMRIVSVWLAINTNGVVIPLVSSGNYLHMEYMLTGMEDCEVVAFNTKGPMGDIGQMRIFKDSIKFTVDRLKNLRRIVVYTTSTDIDKVYSIFQYAIDNNIEIDIPDNMLQTRHRILGVQR